ncbi:MAG TPA: hypothetical protein VFN43_00205, partial [Humibacillus sp.]|nr:hypothetical protein [Humibacillus sp.]
MIGRRSRRPGTTGRRRSLHAVTGVFVVLLAVLTLPVGGAVGSTASAPAGRAAQAAGAAEVAGAAGAVAAASAGTVAGPASTPAVTPDRTRALITLTQVTPTVVKSSTDVTIKGVVTAPLTGPLSAPTVEVRLGSRDITTRVALDDWASGRTAGSGRRVAETVLANVAAGAERPFSVVVPADELRTPEAFAVLPISVEVVQEGAAASIGMTRTFLAWNSRKEFE